MHPYCRRGIPAIDAYLRFTMRGLISQNIVALLGLECTHAVPKSCRGLVEKSSRIVALGVLSVCIILVVKISDK